MIMHIPKTKYYHKWLIGATFVVPILPLAAQTPPNLVFIMADQYRGDALGCLGREPVKTPCLDNLASEGVLFTNAVSSYPVSSPARAMLMTGMYPLHNKVVGNCNSQTAPYGVELPQEARCWSDVLKDMDYRTGYIGKWHLDGGDYFGLGCCPEGWDADYWYDMKCYLNELSENERVCSRQPNESFQPDFSEEFTYAQIGRAHV